MRRVVVTGMGVVSPLGIGAENVWNRLLKSESGIRGVQSCDVTDLPCKIAGEVPLGDASSGKFNADDYVSPKDQKKMDTFIIMAMGAAQQAVEDSGWKPTDEEGQIRTGVPIQQRRLSEIPRHVLRVSCRRCDRIVRGDGVDVLMRDPRQLLVRRRVGRGRVGGSAERQGKQRRAQHGKQGCHRRLSRWRAV